MLQKISKASTKIPIFFHRKKDIRILYALEKDISFYSQNIFYNNQTASMKAGFTAILVMTLLAAAKADYFAGVISNQTLSQQTTNAINALKTTLIADFDCSDSIIRQPFIGIMPTENRGVLLRKRILTTSTLQASGLISNMAVPKCQLISDTRKKTELYNACVTVAGYLAKIKTLISQYNNVIIGSGNTINGTKNFVVGSKDNLSGNNNWVFTSNINLKTVQDGVLIIGNYLIELADIPLIPKDPSQAIRCINTTQSNSVFRSLWNDESSLYRTLM